MAIDATDINRWESEGGLVPEVAAAAAAAAARRRDKTLWRVVALGLAATALLTVYFVPGLRGRLGRALPPRGRE